MMGEKHFNKSDNGTQPNDTNAIQSNNKRCMLQRNC